jgi:hypothetical protein
MRPLCGLSRQSRRRWVERGREDPTLDVDRRLTSHLGGLVVHSARRRGQAFETSESTMAFVEAPSEQGRRNDGLEDPPFNGPLAFEPSAWARLEWWTGSFARAICAASSSKGGLPLLHLE